MHRLALLFIPCFFLVASLASAESAKPSAIHVLPTTEKSLQAAPSMQPAPPSAQVKSGEGASPQVQTEAMPLAPLPDIKNPAPGMQKTDDQKTYVPPELRDKETFDTNMMLPPLYGWQRIVLDDLVMPEKEGLVDSCGMKKDFIFDFFAQRLQEGGVPVVSKARAEKMVRDSVTVHATPLIISMQDLVINCTSWVQFQVTADVTFRVPPMMYRRNVPLLLWNDGMLVTSARSTHNGAVINAFITLAMRFRDAWNAQQAMVDPKRIVR